MSDLKTQDLVRTRTLLIRLGSTNPELRPHIRPLLDSLVSHRKVYASTLIDKINNLKDAEKALAAEPKGSTQALELERVIETEKAKFGFEALGIANALYDRLMPTMDALKFEIREAKKSKSNSKVTQHANRYVAQLRDVQEHSDLVTRLAKENKIKLPKGIPPTPGMLKLVAIAKSTFNHWN